MKREKYFYELGYRILNCGKIISKSGCEIKGGLDGEGYIRVNSRGKFNYFMAHRLQAYQKYFDKIYEKGIEVRHFNSNRIDNSYDNILIGTHKENMMDKPEHIRMAAALYASSFVRKYAREDVVNFHDNNGKSYKKTMAKFNISSKGTLHFILNGRKPKDNHT